MSAIIILWLVAFAFYGICWLFIRFAFGRDEAFGNRWFASCMGLWTILCVFIWYAN